MKKLLVIVVFSLFVVSVGNAQCNATLSGLTWEILYSGVDRPCMDPSLGTYELCLDGSSCNDYYFINVMSGGSASFTSADADAAGDVCFRITANSGASTVEVQIQAGACNPGCNIDDMTVIYIPVC